MRKLLLILFLSGLMMTGSSILAQGITTQEHKPISFTEIDSLSFKLWEAGEWKRVIEIVQAGLNQGVDYYYLRMRIGVAYFNLEKYEKAIPHFRHALSFNEGDQVATEYLFLSMQFAGRNIVEPRKIIASADVGVIMNPDADKMAAYRPEELISANYLIRSYRYLSGGIKARLSKRFSGTFATQSISFDVTQQFSIPGSELLSYHVPFSENSVYLGGSYDFNKGWQLSVGANTLMASYQVMEFKQDGGGGGTYMPVGYNYLDVATHMGVNKRMPYLGVGLSADVNHLKNNWYGQSGVDLSYYPFGNLNLYLNAKLFVTGPLSGMTEGGRIVSHLMLGTRILPKWWVELQFTEGIGKYWTEHQGYVVYNNLDPVKWRMGVNLSGFQITKRLDLVFRYQWSRRVASWYLYEGNNYEGVEEQMYPVHSIFGGITWRF